MSLLQVEGLTVALPPGADRADAVEDVSFALHPGKILCLVGESGSGKSVAASAVMGLLPASLPVRAGRILFEGADLRRVGPEAMRRLRGARLGMIFQEPMTSLNPVLRIGAQLAEVFAVHGRPAEGAVLRLLADVGLPDPPRIAAAWPHQLSGGQRQRVMIAMALALEPSVLIADEPTTALDVTTQAQILALLRELQRRRGMGVLFITHDFGVVADIADAVAVMQHGRIVEQGLAAQVLSAPAHPYTRALIAAVPRGAGAPRAAATGAPLLELRGLRKQFGRAAPAVAEASLTLHEGETLGLVGESGSGKSTLARCVVRLVRPEAGSVRYRGVELTGLSRRGWLPYRQRIQMIFQDPYASLNPRRRVGDIIAEGPVTHGATRAAARALAAELLALVQLDPTAAGRFAHEFSGGQRQRIGIARALAVQPELLIADEPVSALDVSVQAQILALLEDVRARLGLAMLFITHDLRVAARICDRVAVMQRGAIVEQGPTAAVFNRPSHPYTRALLDSMPGRHWAPPAGR